MKFPKITAILIVLLSLSVIALIFVIINNPKVDEEKNEEERTISEIVNRTAVIGFAPEVVVASAGATQTVDLVVSTGENSVSGVQVELMYEPEAIMNVELTPEFTDSFGESASVLFSEIDTEEGRISYAIAIGPNAVPFEGFGKIATLTFNTSTSEAVFPSGIEFFEGTAVTTLDSNESILLTSSPLEIRLTE